MFGVLELIVGMAALAAAMIMLAWIVLGEYQQLFRANLRLVMSLEVFSVIAEIGGPGYFAAILAFCGTWLLMMSNVLGIFVVYSLLT